MEPFWSIELRHHWRRERFQDRWQRQRFEERAGQFEAATPPDLERAVLAEMLEIERTVEAASLGADGRRPLHFWRGHP